MMQLYGHVPSMVHYGVRHVGELHGLSREVASANAEEDLGMNKDLWGRQSRRSGRLSKCLRLKGFDIINIGREREV